MNKIHMVEIKRIVIKTPIIIRIVVQRVMKVQGILCIVKPRMIRHVERGIIMGVLRMMRKIESKMMRILVALVLMSTIVLISQVESTLILTIEEQI